MKKVLTTLLCVTFLLASQSLAYATDPHSTSYSIHQYGFGTGGTDTNTHSSSYKTFGTAGEVEGGNASGTNYKVQTGLTYTLTAAVPASPTLTNASGQNYDRLFVVLNPGGNSTTDTSITYAFEISTDSTFATNVNYIKFDQTMGTTLTTSDFLPYSGWNNGSGFYVTNLTAGTTYYVRAAAKKGNYSQSQWSQASSGIATSNASLTFSLDSNAVTFSNLNAGNSYTDAGKQTVLTVSTNAYNGYTVYAKESAALTSSFTTIADYSGTNASPTTWSGTGFGYTTTDNSLGGTGGLSRFSSGTNYAGFQTAFTNNPVADNPGPVVNPAISGEITTIKYKVAVSNTQPAGAYSNTIFYTIVPMY